MFENIIKNVHNRHPLIHCITNYVSINDCANIVLACGGAPIMAEDINEVSQITSICQGLDINMGCLMIINYHQCLKQVLQPMNLEYQ